MDPATNRQERPTDRERRCGDEIAAQVELSGDGRRDSRIAKAATFAANPARPRAVPLPLSGGRIDRPFGGDMKRRLHHTNQDGPRCPAGRPAAAVYRR